jgi:hypothetical protein
MSDGSTSIFLLTPGSTASSTILALRAFRSATVPLPAVTNCIILSTAIRPIDF